MIASHTLDIVSFITILFLGFYGGTGFFVVMGGNPAIQKMSAHTFAEYWQHTDHHMAARMKIFGPALLIYAFATTVLFYYHSGFTSFILMLGVMVILVADMIFIFNVNHPLNRTIQSWNLDELPGNVPQVRDKVFQAFRIRSVFMIAGFVCGLLALWIK